jgi:hypothetical protein
MEDLYSYLFTGSITYYFVACFYVYAMLVSIAAPVNILLVTTPGYLYSVSKNTLPILRLVALSTVFAFALILVSIVLVIAELR